MAEDEPVCKNLTRTARRFPVSCRTQWPTKPRLWCSVCQKRLLPAGSAS